MRKNIIALLLFLPLVGFSQLSGRVVKIADGDTFTMLTKGNVQVKIRLYGIDCPEKGQDFGKVAKQFLSDLVFDKTVKVRKMKTDRYGRTIGIVTIGNTNVNEALLMAGLAWYYKKYANDPYWAKLEYTARLQKKGLWIREDAIAPWEFRKLKKAS